MREIAPGIRHWTTFHEGIEARVSSYLVIGKDLAFAIDPRVPEEGIEFLRAKKPPAHAYLTNRLHWRHSTQLARAFGTRVHLHRAGLHDVPSSEAVEAFEFGATLPGDVRAVEIASLCPEETAFFLPAHRALALGDSLIRPTGRGRLAFVPEELMGPDPEGVRRGLFAAFERALELDWAHLLLAHGDPIADRGKAALERFVARGRQRRRVA